MFNQQRAVPTQQEMDFHLRSFEVTEGHNRAIVVRLVTQLDAREEGIYKFYLSEDRVAYAYFERSRQNGVPACRKLIPYTNWNYLARQLPLPRASFARDALKIMAESILSGAGKFACFGGMFV